MPTTRSRGLSTADLDSLRTQVEAGRKPKVMFTAAAGQIVGQTGQIIRFDDPAADEWVVVRFGRDELPFAPGDLELPPKQPRTKPTGKAAVTKPTATSNGSAPVPSAAPVAAAASTANRAVTAPTAATPADGAAAARSSAEPAKSAAARTAPAKADPAKTAPAKADPAPAAAADAPAPATPADGAAAAKPRPARKPGTKGKAPELTVSLAHHDGQWTVQATKGARVLIKPSPVRAADALRMVNLLEAPAVAEVVDEIVAAARQDAEDHAARLRRELAEVEAALADLSDDE